MIRDLAPATAFAVDLSGGAFLVGGTAVAPADPDHTLPLLAYLNSPLISRFAERQAPTFKGDFYKFEPGVLSGIPILNAVIENEGVMLQLATLALRRLNIEASGVGAASIEEAINDLIARTALAAGVELVI